jgi:acetyl esterase/lipase
MQASFPDSFRTLRTKLASKEQDGLLSKGELNVLSKYCFRWSTDTGIHAAADLERAASDASSAATTGPGGKQATHEGVIKNRYREGAKEYWIYEPDKPKPSVAPVIIFLHGWAVRIHFITVHGRSHCKARERNYLSAISVEHTDAA